MASKWHFLGFAIEADWVEAWGTWVGGIGTIGAVLWAMFALRREGRRLEAVKDEQALTVLVLDVRRERPSNATGYETLTYVDVGNFGNLPVVELRATLNAGPVSLETPVVRVLRAGEVQTLTFPAASPPVRRLAVRAFFDRDVVVAWTDAYGKSWTRNADLNSTPRRKRLSLKTDPL